MKVVTKTALTEDATSQSKAIRKLEPNEVVMLLSVPCKDSEIDVMRVKVQTLNDGVEGWVTLSGNQGTEYLKEGGKIFKVKKDLPQLPDTSPAWSWQHPEKSGDPAH
eukprot:symbB.v1.2.008171.t1/scaffold512.1/size193505/12